MTNPAVDRILGDLSPISGNGSGARADRDVHGSSISSVAPEHSAEDRWPVLDPAACTAWPVRW